MLFTAATLAGIADGTVDTAFRYWLTPRVRVGSTFRTAIGLVAVTAIEATTLDEMTEDAARRAGYATRAALLASLARHRRGRIYRIGLRFAGPDPRVGLRARTRLDADERARLEHTLARLGAKSREGPWAVDVLRLIEARPGVRAATLAEEMGMDTARFKARVRQLKDLGLTESLEVGYRLSPRGRAVLRELLLR